jgi:hypothetical protein
MLNIQNSLVPVFVVQLCRGRYEPFVDFHSSLDSPRVHFPLDVARPQRVRPEFEASRRQRVLVLPVIGKKTNT